MHYVIPRTWESNTVVIPTNVGIQRMFQQSSFNPIFHRASYGCWIPAYAGMTYNTIVIPAKAGIQRMFQQSSFNPIFHRASYGCWIPAYAGMTGVDAGMTYNTIVIPTNVGIQYHRHSRKSGNPANVSTK